MITNNCIYFISHDTVCPEWMISERYNYCENFSRLLSFFKKK